MRDCWYADNRDLIKWGVLLRLAEKFEARRVVYLAYYRPSTFGQLIIDGQKRDIPEEVIAHFRNLRTVGSMGSNVRVTVFDPVFESEDRHTYLQAVHALLQAFAQEPCVVFLDPDTGLEPRKAGAKHVLNREAKAVWERMKAGDLFVFYQHQTNRAGQPWIESKREQLANALCVPIDAIRKAHAPDIADDVVFFFTPKGLTTGCSGRATGRP